MASVEPPLFAYGSLTFPKIIAQLLEREPETVPARVEGFQRVRVRDKVYPGLVAADGGSVEGMLLTDLLSAERDLLDAFEDDFYRRESVSTLLADGSKAKATTYVIPAENASFATAETWDRDGFYEDYGQRYLEMCRTYRTDYLAGRIGPQDFPGI